MNVVFDSSSHTYTYGEDVWPSVTQIVSAARNPFWTQRAADKGTAAHLAIRLDIAGELDMSSVDQAIVPHLMAWRQFVLDVMPETILSECVVWSQEHKYAGTLDWYGGIGGVPVVVDFKTGAVPKWAGKQLAAYAHALAESHGRVARGARILQLTNTGRYKLLDVGEMALHWRGFLDDLSHHNKGDGNDGRNANRSPA